MLQSKTREMDNCSLSENMGKSVLHEGNAVTRTADACSPEIFRYLHFLEDRGLPVEHPLTIHGGKEIYQYFEGKMVHPGRWRDDALYSIGALLRRMHDAAQEYLPAQPDAFRPWYLREIGGGGRVWCHGDIAPWNMLTKDGMPALLVDWEYSGPLDPMTELARVCWLFVQLHDDDLAELHSLPSPQIRAAQVRLVCDGYGLDSVKRHTLLERILEVVICETAHEAIDPGLTPDSEGTLWGFAWRNRSLYWIWRNRKTIQTALA